MPDRKLNPQRGDAGYLEQDNIYAATDVHERGAGPAPFGEWIASKREQIAATNPEAAAQLAEVHDEAGFRELLRAPEGNTLIGLLIGAKAGTPGAGASASVWDDTDIVHVIEGRGSNITGDWNSDGKDTVGLTARSSSSGTGFDDDAPTTLLDMGAPDGHPSGLHPMDHLGVIVDGQSGDDLVEVEGLLEIDADI